MKKIVILILFFGFGCASGPAAGGKIIAGKTVWTGSWESLSVPADGRLYVLLPAEIPLESEFTAPAVLYYSHLYFFERQKRVELTCKMNQNNTVETGKNIPRKDLRMIIKTKVPGTDQLIEFSAVMNDEKTIIAGGYRTEKPADIGYFYLQKND